MISCNTTGDMFDINGKNKLAATTVKAREQIVKHYSKFRDTLFFLSDSGGKDSQAMKLAVMKYVRPEQIIIVHADLGPEVEHHGVLEHIKRYTPAGIQIEVVRNQLRNLLDGALLRGKWFSSGARYCTSDYKTSQIDKLIRRVCNERGARRAFNVTGLRSKESRGRALKSPLWINKRLTTKKRTVFDFMPIFHYTEDDVYDAIYAAGQEPHPVYGYRGDKNHRLSCVLCVLADKNDLRNGAIGHPDKYHSYIAIERVISHTMFSRKRKGQAIGYSITEKTGVPFDELAVQRKVKEMTKRREALLAKKAEDAEAKRQAKAAGKPVYNKKASADTEDTEENMDLFA